MVFIYFSFHLREMHFIHYLHVVCEVLGGDVSIATFIISFLPFLVVLISKAFPCYIQEQPWTICLNQHEPYHHLSKACYLILPFDENGLEYSQDKTKPVRISSLLFTVCRSFQTPYIRHIYLDVKEDIRDCTCYSGK